MLTIAINSPLLLTVTPLREMDFFQYELETKTVRVEAVYFFLTVWSGVQRGKDLYAALDSSLCILAATYTQLSKEESIFIADLL